MTSLNLKEPDQNTVLESRVYVWYKTTDHSFQVFRNLETRPILLQTFLATDKTMLYFIGLGLGDAEDITVKGLQLVKNATKVYLEAYTSILTVGKEALVITCDASATSARL